MKFTVETKVNGEYVKGIIKLYQPPAYRGLVSNGKVASQPEVYKARLDFDEVADLQQPLTADELRTLMYEIEDVANKLDEMNGVPKAGERK